ncbi:AI-2 transport protein TqsA [Roseimaritima multifibrata]|uniref:AI-2 transport protein TqsA n=1 Tax=Roseimaritima multifibrata TaxID=1930274 RepID=A0A517MHG8_9BACT|nr:AI-2E family transporter [Roseimaritima multifibrata]QDS94321.1 AI-2 transport protein TqsA [Roseimaritima multifibrata]
MESQPSHAKIQTFCLVVIATAVVIYLIYWLRPVLVPFVVAAFVVSGVTPIVEAFEKRLGVSRVIAAGLTFLIGLMATVVLGICLWLSVAQMAEHGDLYRIRVLKLSTTIDKVITDTHNWARQFSLTSELDYELDGSTDAEFASQSNLDLHGETSDPLRSDLAAAPTGVQREIANSKHPRVEFQNSIDAMLKNGLTKLSGELFSLVTTSIIVLIYVFFLLLGSVDVPSPDSSLQRINQQIRNYLSLKTLISMATGGLFGLTLWIFGVPMALTFGVMAFLLNFIPNIGPMVATILPIPLIILQPEGSIAWMTVTILAISSIQLTSGNVIEPKLMGDSSGLHPVIILLALMFWGMMWGITGMFLATPIAAGIKIALESIDSTKPITELMAGRWNEAFSRKA